MGLCARILALLAALAAPALGLETLRLPWIFSDEPEITADFAFQPGPAGKTTVELALGGRFSRFGLPRGAARAPVLTTACEFISPGDLVSQAGHLETVLDLNEVLREYGQEFSKAAFSKKSPYVFKHEFSANLAPGDYNVVLSLADKELSIHSRRTLHLIVPRMSGQSGRLGDLKFCLGVGQELDAGGRTVTLLDPNPWRQAGGRQHWDLLVAYNLLGPGPSGKLMRRHTVWKLRSPDEEPLWSEEGEAPAKRPSQRWLARLDSARLESMGRGIYVFKAELWSAANPAQVLSASKTFEVLP